MFNFIIVNRIYKLDSVVRDELTPADDLLKNSSWYGYE